MRPLGFAWRRLATVLVVVGLLSGCTVGPNYRRPEVIVPADWRNAPEQRNSLGDLGWWGIFQDPALHELLSTAVVANRDVQVAVARVLESRAQLGVARAAQFPQVNAGASYQYTRPFSANSPVLNGSPRGPFTGDDFQTSLDLTFELDLWGRLRRATEAARAELLATEENRRVVLMTLVSDVARTYFDLLELDRELEIARRTLQTRQESLQLERRRFERGLSTQLDVDRADAEAAVAAATVPDLERRIVQNENGLSVLLGRNPGPIARGTPLDRQRLSPEVPAGLPSALLERRPDLRQAEQTLVAANARIGVAKAEYFPKISLTALLGTASPEVSALTSGGATIWAVAGLVSGPLLNAGRTLGTYRAATAQSEQARLQFEQTILLALREVSDVLTRLARLSAAETAQDMAVKALGEAVDHAMDRYRQGLANYFEVLEAQQQLYPAQNTLAQIRQNRLLAYAQLYRALGGGWTLTDAQWQGEAATK